MSKRIAILTKTSGDNVVVVSFNGKENTISQNSSAKLGVLKELKKVLAEIPKNDINNIKNIEFTTVYCADVIGKPFSMGTIGEWIRNGKTSSTQNVLSAEEIKLVSEVYQMLAERQLNVRVSAVDYMNKSKEYNVKSFASQAWNALTRATITVNSSSSNNNNQNFIAVESEETKSLREKINKLNNDLEDAIINGDEELEEKLEKKVDKLMKLLEKRRIIDGVNKEQSNSENNNASEQKEEPSNERETDKYPDAEFDENGMPVDWDEM